jgi:hypothetical protein
MVNPRGKKFTNGTYTAEDEAWVEEHVTNHPLVQHMPGIDFSLREFLREYVFVTRNFKLLSNFPFSSTCVFFV